MWREICKNCGRITAVGFTVPDEVWEESVPSFYCNSVLCIICFAQFADESLIEWDKEIEFWPVSQYTLINQEEQ